MKTSGSKKFAQPGTTTLRWAWSWSEARSKRRPNTGGAITSQNRSKHWRRKTYPQILNEVVKNTKAFRVLAILDIDQRADFCGLGRCQRSGQGGVNPGLVLSHLESNMIVSNANLQLLLSNYVLLWPVRIVFPGRLSIRCRNPRVPRPLTWRSH